MPQTEPDPFASKPKGLTFTGIYRDVHTHFKLGGSLEDVTKFWELPRLTQALGIVYIEIQDQLEYIKGIESTKKTAPPVTDKDFA